MGTPDVGLAKGSGLHEELAAALLFRPIGLPNARQLVTMVYWPPCRTEGIGDFGSLPQRATVSVAAPTPSPAIGTILVAEPDLDLS